MDAFCFDTVDSTNEVAKRLIADGRICGPAYVFAREQTAGKGTKGRGWVSPRDAGIYVSVIEPHCKPVRATTQYTLIVGHACVEWLKRQTGVRAQLKPINDLYVDGCKLGGILTEALFSGGDLTTLIIGVGINLRKLERQLPPGAPRAIALEEVLPPGDDAHGNAEALVEQLVQHVHGGIRTAAAL